MAKVKVLSILSHTNPALGDVAISTGFLALRRDVD
jgi:hypothetical protein